MRYSNVKQAAAGRLKKTDRRGACVQPEEQCHINQSDLVDFLMLYDMLVEEELLGEAEEPGKGVISFQCFEYEGQPAFSVIFKDITERK